LHSLEQKEAPFVIMLVPILGTWSVFVTLDAGLQVSLEDSEEPKKGASASSTTKQLKELEEVSAPLSHIPTLVLQHVGCPT
jgi:hypothetical protein